MHLALRNTATSVYLGTHKAWFHSSSLLYPVISRSFTRVKCSQLPTLLDSQSVSTDHLKQQPRSTFGTHNQPSEAQPTFAALVHEVLPLSCPGCGALSQTCNGDAAGYYSLDQKAVRRYLHYGESKASVATKEDEVFLKALQNANPETLKDLELCQVDNGPPKEASIPSTPLCARCHNLIHHSAGTPIQHPTVEAIQQTIAESLHKHNHIYHVLDAADFPLSMIPNLQSSLRIPKLRTQNRRAKHKGWVANDRIVEVTFIITRADLLAPNKQQVDTMLPYFTEILRDALGRQNANARLGNVRLVSAKRGWWTRPIKEDIWDRGGAAWMVGKVNVGKSNLFATVFPKGRDENYQAMQKAREADERGRRLGAAQALEKVAEAQSQLAREDAEIERLDEISPKRKHGLTSSREEGPEIQEQDEEEDFDDLDALLPPLQPYTPFPVLPITSPLPGTTASPIRVPFGRNRGELIDLPGLARTKPGLETFVTPSEHHQLVMETRITAERHVLKPGQSLILGGGLIRITPMTENLIFLVHPFVPLHAHVTRTEKAMAFQLQESDRQLQVPPILAHNIGSQMRSAGQFCLRWDATKKLAGPVTHAAAGKMKPENLPFRVWSTDILLEGVGWIEVSAQTRRPAGWKAPGLVKKDPNHAQHARRASLEEPEAIGRREFATHDLAEQEGVNPHNEFVEDFGHTARSDETSGNLDNAPMIEVFSPLGKFIGQRQPMCASLVSGPKRIARRDHKTRPRRSMTSVKKQRKPCSA